MRTPLGFLGLGVMGTEMAIRLLTAGYDLVVWNRSPGATEPLVDAGARRAQTAEEALAAEVSFSMLASDEAVEEVFTDAVIDGLGGRTHVLMSSISPLMAESLAARFASCGAHYVAAPVLGRPDVAAAGALNILAAGDCAAIDAVVPYLDHLGSRVWRVGTRPELANVVKATVNYNIIHAMQAIGESVAMTERLGVAPELFTELLSSTLFGGVVYTGYGRIISEGRYIPPGFHIALGRKDLALAQQVAESAGVTAATLPVLVDAFERAMAQPDLADADWAAIAEVPRRDLNA